MLACHSELEKKRQKINTKWTYRKSLHTVSDSYIEYTYNVDS